MADEGYGLSETRASVLGEAPLMDYLPAVVKSRPKIGLIGAGGITEYHLRAYKKAGLEVVAIANPRLEKAEARRDEFYPEATVYTHAELVLRRDDIDIVDIATHPEPRVSLIERAIEAGKDILSQKPFVTDLDIGERLVDAAGAKGVLLGVNQNGRWAPHYRWLLQAVRSGLVGRLGSVVFSQQWDHRWTEGTAFEDIHHLLLYDFGVHWFDFAHAFTGEAAAERVYASVRRASYQKAKPPFLASAIIDYPEAQLGIHFNANTVYGQEDRVVVCGEKGTLRSHGEGLNQHRVDFFAEGLRGSPDLEGEWFTNGFAGTMLELIAAREEGREPENSARDNLKSLELCFAAIRSADTGMPQIPGTVRSLPE